MARYSAARWKPIGSGGTVKMARYDLLVVHTMVGNLVGTDNYFRQQPNNSHFGLGGKWGADAGANLDGELYQWVDTAFRSAATREGNPRVIAVECADNAPANPADIQPFTPAQQDALVALMIWVHETHGIPLLAAHDSKPDTVGIGYHKLGVDPYRVAGGELWSSAYGKVCPGDARIRQIPGLIERARASVNIEGDDMSAEDVQAINEHTDAQVAELLRVLGANLGESAVNNPRAWLNAGIAARLTANERANLAPLLDDEAKLREVVGDIPAGLTVEDIKAALRVVLAEPAGA